MWPCGTEATRTAPARNLYRRSGIVSRSRQLLSGFSPTRHRIFPARQDPFSWRRIKWWLEASAAGGREMRKGKILLIGVVVSFAFWLLAQAAASPEVITSGK